MGSNGEWLVIEKYRKISKNNPKSAMKAIRAHCIECSGGVTKEVKECVIPDCTLYPFRMGRRLDIER